MWPACQAQGTHLAAAAELATEIWLVGPRAATTGTPGFAAFPDLLGTVRASDPVTGTEHVKTTT
jgi:hypothetical protein